jgi:hypothetical protein
MMARSGRRQTATACWHPSASASARFAPLSTVTRTLDIWDDSRVICLSWCSSLCNSPTSIGITSYMCRWCCVFIIKYNHVPEDAKYVLFADHHFVGVEILSGGIRLHQSCRRHEYTSLLVLDVVDYEAILVPTFMYVYIKNSDIYFSACIMLGACGLHIIL